MFLSIFIHCNYLFQTITQPFYIASSHISIRTRNKLSAGVKIIRAGGAAGKNFFRKNLTMPKIVPKMSIPYLCRTHSARAQKIVGCKSESSVIRVVSRSESSIT